MYFLHPMYEAASKCPNFRSLTLVCRLTDNERILTQKGIYNKMPGISALRSKGKLATVLQRMVSLYGDEFDFAPRTFVMPQDRAAL